MSEARPDCYGKHWDAQAVECKGGLDPSYVGIHGNTRVRCKWYQECSSATNNSRIRMATPQGYSPLPYTPPAPTAITQQPYHLPIQQYTAPKPVQQQQVYQAPVQPVMQPVMHAGVMYAPVAQAAVPQMVPMNQMMPGAQTQCFIAIPEQSNSWAGGFVGTMSRSVMKVGLLALANYLDYHPFHRRT